MILSSKRAKQLLKGAKPKLRMKTKNLIRIAQEEVKQGLIDYEIKKPKEGELVPAEDEMFIGEEIAGPAPASNVEEKAKTAKTKELKPEKADEKSPEPAKSKK